MLLLKLLDSPTSEIYSYNDCGSFVFKSNVTYNSSNELSILTSSKTLASE
jgi:hypothetical protein